MEALVAFGLACNVMQVIGFVKDGIQVGKAIYETGCLDPHLAQTTDYLTESLEALRSSLSRVPPLRKEDQELLAIAKGSLDTATQLKTELEKISGTMTKGKHSAAFRGWFSAAFGGKKRIEKLEKAMRDRQHVLETRLLIRICNKNDAILIQQQADFDKLDKILQGFIQARAHDQTALGQLIRSESTAVKIHVDNNTKALKQSLEVIISSESNQVQARLQDLTLNQICKEEHEQLLGSFKHDSMNARRNQILKNHNDTLSWIFNTDYVDNDATIGTSISSFSDSHPHIGHTGFVNWLQFSQQRPFWISGKAGSGKSVLMRFLVDHPRTNDILVASHGRTIILSHFLWAVGQPLEKTLQGILCSLAHQLLCTRPHLSGRVLEKYSNTRQKGFPGDWSNDELFDVAFYMFSQCEQHICIFLDGLDEIDTQDDQRALKGLLDKFRALERLQVCISSRPEPVLQRYFGSCPQLRVQDLTRFDIEKYAKDTLQELFSGDTTRLKRLVSTICSKADGVFLWVALALKSLQIGYENHDDPAELERRLELLPNDLNTLYQQMWRRLNDSEQVYRKTAGEYFNLLLECIDSQKILPTTSIIILALALNPTLAARVVTSDIESFADELNIECDRMSKRLPIRCAGLLEVSQDGTVTFIHRSAQEFLVNTPDGQQIRQADQTPSETLLLNIARGLLGCIRLEIQTRRNSAPTKFSSPMLGFCKRLGGISTMAGLVLSNSYEAFVFKKRLSAGSVNEFLHLAQALYSAGEWGYDSGFLVQPDFYGAIARAGFFDQALQGISQLASSAPAGMRVSTLYKAYIFDLARSFLRVPGFIFTQHSATQDYALFWSLGETTPGRQNMHGLMSYDQLIIDEARNLTPQYPNYSLTGDPLGALLELSLENHSHFGLVIELLGRGYNLPNRSVILLNTTSVNLSTLLGISLHHHLQNLDRGDFLVEVNTSFCLSVYVRFLSSRRAFFPRHFEQPTMFERLIAGVEKLATPTSARLLAFIPVLSERTEYISCGSTSPTTDPRDESLKNLHSTYEHCGSENREKDKREGEQLDDENSLRERDQGDFHRESDNSERRAGIYSTEILIPRTKDDSDFVLESLSGDIFKSPTIRKGGPYGLVAVPELESRIQQISSRARRSTVHELWQILIRAGYLVPSHDVENVWPPSVYSLDVEDDEDEVVDSVIQDLLKW